MLLAAFSLRSALACSPSFLRHPIQASQLRQFGYVKVVVKTVKVAKITDEVVKVRTGV